MPFLLLMFYVVWEGEVRERRRSVFGGVSFCGENVPEMQLAMNDVVKDELKDGGVAMNCMSN